MTVEAVTHISDLNATYPASGDSRSEGDDHIRNIKTALKTDFPNISGAMTQTHTTLNNIGLVLLATASASSSATIDFTSLIDSTYEEYELHIINAVPATDAAVPWLRTTANSGSSYDSTAGDYGWSIYGYTIPGDGGSNGGTTATKIELSPAGVDNATAYGGFSSVIRFFDPAGTAHYKRFNWAGSSPETNAVDDMTVMIGTGMRVATAAINGVRFLFSTGNIASGKFKLYGVKK